jgi:hypothetical protein
MDLETIHLHVQSELYSIYKDEVHYTTSSVYERDAILKIIYKIKNFFSLI